MFLNLEIRFSGGNNIRISESKEISKLIEEGIVSEKAKNGLKELPNELVFPTRMQGSFKMPGAELPTPIRLNGDVKFHFEPTDNPEILLVKLKDVNWIIEPFVLLFDVDGDGILEGIQLINIEVDMGFFDAKECKGTVNLETGNFEFTWKVSIDLKDVISKYINSIPDSIKDRLELLDFGKVEVPIHDTGKMNIEKRSIKVRAGLIYVIPDGPLAGMEVSGVFDCCIGTINVPSSFTFKASKLGPNCYSEGSTEVTICEGDEIALCFNFVSVDIKEILIMPGNIRVPLYTPEGKYMGPNYFYKIVQPPSSKKKVIYTATVVDGTNPGKSEQIAVNILPEKAIMTARAIPTYPCTYEIIIPPSSQSSRLRVRKIWLNPEVDCLNDIPNDYGLNISHFSPNSNYPDYTNDFTNFTDKLTLSLPVNPAGSWLFKLKKPDRVGEDWKCPSDEEFIQTYIKPISFSLEIRCGI